uniref:Sulfide:quinone oxidoreductase, mitochondrial n=1 Tax=Lygus hesperus TaxID=30085 RepID=A0A0A9X5R5_LYGHE
MSSSCVRPATRKLARVNLSPILRHHVRLMSTANADSENHKCKLLVLGGGTGGCTVASKFIPKLGKNEVAIVEPADLHYYQPMFTMIGGGMKKLKSAFRPMSQVIPKDAVWIKESVSAINPKTNTVTTTRGKKIEYDYLVVSLGLELRYDKVHGLLEALEAPDSGVASNYSPKYVERTYRFLKDTKTGKAVFTFPVGAVKCAGAPLKACLISEDYFRRMGRRNDVEVLYRSSLPVIFSAKHYAKQLNKLCAERNIDVGFQQELVNVDHKAKEAVFKNLAGPSELTSIKFSFLHVTPPMSPPEVLNTSPELIDAAGFLDVDKSTLQSKAFSNVYGIGDCTNLPTSKTAAAVAAQSGVLFNNLLNDMNGRTEKETYDGYTSCPLVTGYSSVILAEFDYTLEPLETFPIDQSKEHRSMFYMKKDAMPFLYWNGMLKGYWNGPGFMRKVLHLGMGR